MNHVAAKNHFGALVEIDIKNGRSGAGTVVLGLSVAAAAHLTNSV